MVYSADDLIGATEMTADESAYVYERLILGMNPSPHHQSVRQFAHHNNLMPMLVARTLAERRESDTALNSLIATNEFLIKNFGKNRLSREFVEGTLIKTDKIWRSNDPLGVYQPGDLFYVDDNHPWRQVFPLLVFAPTAICVLLVGILVVVQSLTH